MEIIELSIDEIFQDPNNVRLHDDKNLEAIKGSIKKFGFQSPIVIDKNNIILAGNGRHMAAKAMGLKTIPCIVSDLENFEKMAFSLADNRTAELATWNMEKLAEQLEIIEDRELIGFTDDFKSFDDGFDFKEPSDDIKEKELKLIIICDDDSQIENLFQELNDRGLRVKIG